MSLKCLNRISLLFLIWYDLQSWNIPPLHYRFQMFVHLIIVSFHMPYYSLCTYNLAVYLSPSELVLFVIISMSLYVYFIGTLLVCPSFSLYYNHHHLKESSFRYKNGCRGLDCELKNWFNTMLIITLRSLEWRHKSAMASQITGNLTVCSALCSGKIRGSIKDSRNWYLWEHQYHWKYSHVMTSSWCICHRTQTHMISFALLWSITTIWPGPNGNHFQNGNFEWILNKIDVYLVEISVEDFP